MSTYADVGVDKKSSVSNAGTGPFHALVLRPLVIAPQESQWHQHVAKESESSQRQDSRKECLLGVASSGHGSNTAIARGSVRAHGWKIKELIKAKTE